jgi:hypothetical protein
LDVAETAAQGNSGTLSRETLLGEIPAKFRSHMRDCETCAQAVDDLVATRNSLADHPPIATFDAPWFAARVMARISAEERKRAGQDTVWSVLPRLASRFAGAALILIVITGGLVIRKPAERAGTQPAIESLFDTSSTALTHDDVLSTVLEKAR